MPGYSIEGEFKNVIDYGNSEKSRLRVRVIFGEAAIFTVQQIRIQIKALRSNRLHSKLCGIDDVSTVVIDDLASLWHLRGNFSDQRNPSLPLNSRWRFARNVVGHAGYARDFVDDAAR